MGVLGLLATIAALCALCSAGAAWAGEIVENEGVPHVRNPAAPPGGLVSLEFQERWRVGSESEDLLLGVVTAAVADEQGVIYLVDRQLSEVHIFGPDGAYLRSIGAQGEGPGEVSRLGGLVLLPDGLIGMIQSFPGKIVMLDANGIPAGTLVPGDLQAKDGGFSSLGTAACRGGQLVLGGAKMHRDGSRFHRLEFVGIYEADGTPRGRIFENATEPDFSNIEWVEKDNYSITRDGLWALGPDGRIYAASFRDRYAIEVYDATGRLERVIEREYAPYKRTAEEKAEVGSGMLIVVDGRRTDIEIHAEDHEPCISRLSVDPDGWLWVANGHSSRGQPEGVFATVDLFDPEGHFRKQVALACPGNPERDRLLMLENGQFLMIRGFEDAARSLRAGFGDEEDEPAEVEEVPLEIILYEAAEIH